MENSDYIRLLRNEEKLKEAEIQRQAAQAANETKTLFLANMSHEIRTPMNAILGMSELLLQEKLNKRQLRYANDIRAAATALLDIINDILDVSKMQAGKLTLVPVHYDFHMLIDNISSMTQFLVDGKHLSFKLTMQEQTPVCLYGDDVRLRQVLVNLLSNAAKFTEAGCVELAVGHTADSVIISVSDTGIGIAAESIPTLFDAFEQFDLEKNRHKRGTGLGLTITKAVVEMMGGNITVESVYGQGSVFRVEIPKVLGDEKKIYRADEKDILIYAPDADILVVDDNKTNLSVACGLLQLCGISAKTAESGRRAIEMVKRRRYDIVFMDHRMPEMSGVETTKLIRGLGIDVPIIALTASALAGSKEMMLRAGMNDYLWKPVKKSDLMRMLKKWLPDGKVSSPPQGADDTAQDGDGGRSEFWDKIGRIEGLSAQAGLDRAGGRRGAYEKNLKLMLREIPKTVKNLSKFLSAGDMTGFRIEAHGVKSALASIGAAELSKNALELETASYKNDCDFCAFHLKGFIKGLNRLSRLLKEAFASIKRKGVPAEIPPELVSIFQRTAEALAEEDLVRIENETANLNKHTDGALQEEIGRINDMVMVMDYAGAAEYIQKLIKGARKQ